MGLPAGVRESSLKLLPDASSEGLSSLSDVPETLSSLSDKEFTYFPWSCFEFTVDSTVSSLSLLLMMVDPSVFSISCSSSLFLFWDWPGKTDDVWLMFLLKRLAYDLGQEKKSVTQLCTQCRRRCWCILSICGHTASISVGHNPLHDSLLNCIQIILIFKEHTFITWHKKTPFHVQIYIVTKQLYMYLETLVKCPFLNTLDKQIKGKG